MLFAHKKTKSSYEDLLSTPFGTESSYEETNSSHNEIESSYEELISSHNEELSLCEEIEFSYEELLSAPFGRESSYEESESLCEKIGFTTAEGRLRRSSGPSRACAAARRAATAGSPCRGEYTSPACGDRRDPRRRRERRDSARPSRLSGGSPGRSRART